MALIEQRTRAATVIAKDRCLLLEIDGDAFIKVLQRHADVEFKIMRELSDRLRRLSDQVLAETGNGVGDKLKLFNARLDAELKAINASLMATQTIFDQTSKRADEVISSAERSRTRLTFTATTVGAVVTILGTTLGALGFSEFKGIENGMIETVKEITTYRDQAKDATAMATRAATKAADQLASADEKMKKFDAMTADLRSKYDAQRSQYEAELGTYRALLNVPDKFAGELITDRNAALKTYLWSSKLDNPELMDALYSNLVTGIVLKPTVRSSYANFLEDALAVPAPMSPREKVSLYYLLLLSMVLDTSSDTQAFKDIRSDYERYMRQHRGENIRAAFPQDLADTEIEKMVQSLALSASEKIAVMDNVKELFAVIHD